MVFNLENFVIYRSSQSSHRLTSSQSIDRNEKLIVKIIALFVLFGILFSSKTFFGRNSKKINFLESNDKVLRTTEMDMRKRTFGLETSDLDENIKARAKIQFDAKFREYKKFIKDEILKKRIEGLHKEKNKLELEFLKATERYEKEKDESRKDIEAIQRLMDQIDSLAEKVNIWMPGTTDYSTD